MNPKQWPLECDRNWILITLLFEIFCSTMSSRNFPLKLTGVEKQDVIGEWVSYFL